MVNKYGVGARPQNVLCRDPANSTANRPTTISPPLSLSKTLLRKLCLHSTHSHLFIPYATSHIIAPPLALSSMAEPVHETPEWEKPAARQSLFQKINPFSKQSNIVSKDSERIVEEGPIEGTEGTATTKRAFPWVPRWCAFIGRSRRSMALSIAALVFLLALVLGLGLGLGLNKSFVINLTTFVPETVI